MKKYARVETAKSAMILESALTWFFRRTVPTSRKAKPACMASTMTAPAKMNMVLAPCTRFATALLLRPSIYPSQLAENLRKLRTCPFALFRTKLAIRNDVAHQNAPRAPDGMRLDVSRG